MKRGLKKFFKRSKSIKLDALRFGLAGGIISALCVALSTIVGMFSYYEIHNSMMIEMYGMFGYSISWMGVFFGAIYGFLDGFVVAWLLILIYNKLL